MWQTVIRNEYKFYIFAFLLCLYKQKCFLFINYLRKRYNIAIRIKKKYQGRQREVNNDIVNEKIRDEKLLVILKDGEKPVEMLTKDALSKAQDLELDLVLIAPNAPIPVAKIIDYGKFKYERKKKEQQKKKNQKVVEVKEVRLTQRIGEHDLQVKLKDAKRFLEKGNKVKVSLRFRRNEMGDKTKAMELMNRFIEELSEIAKVSSEPKARAIFLDMMLEPTNKKK